MEQKFNQAAEAIKTVGPDAISDEDKLKLYARYKQVIIGDNATAKPGFLDLKGKAKWQAWNSVKGMSKEQAMAEYVDVAKTYFPSQLAAQF